MLLFTGRGRDIVTNAYPDDAPLEVKIHEELRCLRCVLERILRVMGEAQLDYTIKLWFRR